MYDHCKSTKQKKVVPGQNYEKKNEIWSVESIFKTPHLRSLALISPF